MSSAAKFKRLEPGEPGPYFIQRSASRDRYVFDTTAGRYLVLYFIGSAADPAGRALLAAALKARDVFNDQHASFFCLTFDKGDESQARLNDVIPGFRTIWDFEGEVAKAYGALDIAATRIGNGIAFRRLCIVLDPTMRVLDIFSAPTTEEEAGRIVSHVRNLPPPQVFAGEEVFAPVLRLPRVFEPELCQRLIDAYETSGGEESGFMREIDGRTLVVQDPGHKRRRDHVLADEALCATVRDRIWRRLAPELRKVHHYQATRMERYIVACYSGDDGGHFRPHRDNTTKGTAHRKFAVSINLNSDFEGGEIGFPEYGPRTYKPAPGAAVVFSCSLLHTVTPVTSGRRFAFLPFLYDEEAARLREENNKFLGANVEAYKNEAPTIEPGPENS